MVTRDEAPASVEGREIRVLGQRIAPQNRRPLEVQNEIVFPLSVKRNGKGTIVSEYDPKRWRFSADSMLVFT